MYQFDLPVGAIVVIEGVEYRHIGEGRFTGLNSDARPYILQGSMTFPYGEPETVIVSEIKPIFTNRRVFFFAKTEAELV